MHAAPISYTLSTAEIDAVVDALTRAAAAFRPTPAEERRYRAFKICATMAVVAFLLTVVLLSFSMGDLPVGLAVIVFFGAVVVATLLLLANLKLVLSTFRQQRRLKQLGLDKAAYSAVWAPRRQGVLTRLGSFAVTALVVALLSIWLLWWIAGNEPTLDETIGVASLPVLGAVLLVWRSVQRRRDRIELVADAGRLRAQLTSLQPGGHAVVEVPAETMAKVARIERAQIAKDRAGAVLTSVTARSRAFAVQLTHEVAQQKSTLPPEQRLEVEELVEQLAAYSWPANGPGGPSAQLQARTPSGGVVLDYSVDVHNLRIHIGALHRSQSAPTTSEASHAS